MQISDVFIQCSSCYIFETLGLFLTELICLLCKIVFIFLMLFVHSWQNWVIGGSNLILMYDEKYWDLLALWKYTGHTAIADRGIV